MSADVNMNFVSLMVFAFLILVIWRATHNLDFNWKPNDVRLKVRVAKRRARIISKRRRGKRNLT
jgi:hypothetical protein